MIGGSLYILTCSARNRTSQRLRRLREPRYLLGALAGIAYLAFTLVIRERAYADGGTGRETEAAATLFGYPGVIVASVLLACAAAASWLMPFGSALLELTDAETAFLFPAPLTRPQLVLHRLLRSQAAVFTGALIVALAYPTGSLVDRSRGLLSVWLLLMTSHVFFTVVTLARMRLRAGTRGLTFIWPALLLPAAPLVMLSRALYAATRHDALSNVSGVMETIVDAAGQGVTHLFLWPFAILVRPLFSRSAGEFALALAGAGAVYAVAVCWLLWADARSVDVADATAERQVNGPIRRVRTYVMRPVGWRLASSGREEGVFIWKGFLQTFRTVDRRMLVRVAAILAWMIVASLFTARARGLVMVLGVFATWGALFTLFMGPQIVSTDLRQDLAHLELIKTWPLRGASVLRGEIVWPAIVITLIAWAFGLIAMTFSIASLSRVPTPNRIAVWLSLLILAPAVVVAQYTMHNAVAVLFPGWVPVGALRPRGVDAVGQRLIVLAGNWLGLLIALAPGIAVTIALSLWLRPIVGPFVLPVGALVTTLTVVGEMWVVTAALGPLFERLDLTSVERPD